jgi:ligand-binding SRPBCC domain-containing protein
VLLHALQTFAGPPEEVFPFFADAGNLERITPPWLRFRILTEPEIEMREGTLIDYALRLGVLPLRWRSEIVDWRPGEQFTDRQLRGPYRRWIHQHRFLPSGPNTIVQDRVEYEVPGGAAVERVLVRPQLRRIFEFRQAALGELFGESGPRRLYFGGEEPRPDPARH